MMMMMDLNNDDGDYDQNNDDDLNKNCSGGQHGGGWDSVPADGECGLWSAFTFTYNGVQQKVVGDDVDFTKLEISFDHTESVCFTKYYKVYTYIFKN